MKIACVTDDGLTISQHFGRARHYAVLTVDDGRIVNREMRDKLGHQQFAAEAHQESPDVPHGTDAASRDKHIRMAHAIADCNVLLCRGMGYGAYQSMQRLGITPIITDVADIEEAALAYAAGRLADHPEKLHK